MFMGTFMQLKSNAPVQVLPKPGEFCDGIGFVLKVVALTQAKGFEKKLMDPWCESGDESDASDLVENLLLPKKTCKAPPVALAPSVALPPAPHAVGVPKKARGAK